MRIRTRLGMLACAAVLGGAGCATINYDTGTLEGLVAMNRIAEPATYERVGGISVRQRPIFAISQLLTIVDANLENALRRELARTGGNAVINLRFHEEYDIIDVAIAMLVGGWVNTRSVLIEGDIVRWRTGFEPETLERLGHACRTIDVPDGEASRTAFVCIPGETVATE